MPKSINNKSEKFKSKLNSSRFTYGLVRKYFPGYIKIHPNFVDTKLFENFRTNLRGFSTFAYVVSMDKKESRNPRKKRIKSVIASINKLLRSLKDIDVIYDQSMKLTKEQLQYLERLCESQLKLERSEITYSAQSERIGPLISVLAKLYENSHGSGTVTRSKKNKGYQFIKEISLNFYNVSEKTIQVAVDYYNQGFRVVDYGNQIVGNHSILGNFESPKEYNRTKSNKSKFSLIKDIGSPIRRIFNKKFANDTKKILTNVIKENDLSRKGNRKIH